MPKITTKSLYVRGETTDWTAIPTAGQPVHPIAKTKNMGKPVGRDLRGRLWTSDVRTEYFKDTGEFLIGENGKPVVGKPAEESEVKILNGRALCDNTARDMANNAMAEAQKPVIEAGFATVEIREDGHLYLTRTANMIDNMNFRLTEDGRLEVIIGE